MKSLAVGFRPWLGDRVIEELSNKPQSFEGANDSAACRPEEGLSCGEEVSIGHISDEQPLLHMQMIPCQ